MRMMNMNRIAAVVMLALSGCISISTYEQQMKKCRDSMAEADQMRAQLATLNTKNAELEKNVAKKTREQEALKSEMSDVRGTYDELVRELKDTIAQGEVGVKQTEDGLTITMGNQILFKSGKSELQPKGMKVLTQVAGVLSKTEDKLIQVQGHTDNVPISGSLKNQYPSNWELSAARAASVVRYLQESGQINPSILVLTAYAENHPLAENTTSEGRQQNRRVEIKLVPKK